MRRTFSSALLGALSLAAVVLCFGPGGREAHAQQPPDFFFFDMSCPDGQVLKGITAEGPICVALPQFKPQVRVVAGTLTDSFHSIYEARCNGDEQIIGGRCQCHASGTWLAGAYNNAYQCACTANTQHTGALAVCMKVK